MEVKEKSNEVKQPGNLNKNTVKNVIGGTLPSTSTFNSIKEDTQESSSRAIDMSQQSMWGELRYDIADKYKIHYIDAYSDLIYNVQEKMEQLGLGILYRGEISMSAISKKLNLPEYFIKQTSATLRRGGKLTATSLDALTEALEQTLKGLVSEQDWNSINEKLLNIYKFSGYVDFQSDRFGIPRSMRRIALERHENFIKPSIDLDKLVQLTVRSYQRQISVFQSMDISVNSYSQQELNAIMMNRKLYNWYGLIYKFTLIKDFQNRRLISPGYTKHVVGFTTSKDTEERFGLYLRIAQLNPQSPMHNTINSLIANGINPRDAFDLEILEFSWSPFDLAIAERNWIASTLALNPLIGLNIHPGGGGYLTSSSAIPVDYLIEYIAKGYNEKEILVALQSERGLTSLSYHMVVESIHKQWGSLKEAQETYLAPILKRLIEYGYLEEDLTNRFGPAGRGLGTISTTWIPKFLGFKSFTDARNTLIKEKLKKLIMRGNSKTQIYQAFPAMSQASVRDHIKTHWSSIEKARTILLKPYLDFFFTNKYPDNDIIKRLNLDDTIPLYFKEGNRRVSLMNEEELLTYLVQLIYKTSIDVARYQTFSEFIGHIM